MQFVNIKLRCFVADNGEDALEQAARQLAAHCNGNAAGHNGCPTGALECPFMMDYDTDCEDVTPQDWLKHLEVEQ